MSDPAAVSDPADVVVIGAARTPFARLNGALASLPATALGAHAITAALAQAQLPGDEVDAVFLGQVLQAGTGQNPARQAALGGGVGPRAHASAINKVCLSGLSAVIDAARLIRSGEAQVVVAGGMESMSQAPHLLPGVRGGWTYGDRTAVDHLAYDGLTDAVEQISMGELTERGSAGFPGTDLSRTAQDAWAATSHQRAAAATAAGTFAAEIAPVKVRTRKAETEVSSDEGIRPGTTTESLAGLRPAFATGGAITAGNASQLTDGAAALVLTTRARAEAAGAPVLVAVRACGQVAGPDNSLHTQPANAIAQALDRAGWMPSELAHVEVNEAFAAVVLASIAALGIAADRVNPHGGAIALGHPIGASGARLAVHLAHTLQPGQRGAAGLCGGGGQGEALLLEG
ncbi:acetyl-CoA C-acyltransferase [Ruania zhangjianzhongii]|uniref:acetyl-CoA C-acyltransferase n=1 Tax=Ruania zhangjianzhongii TaxID=2603206 RepID=UPI0011C97026|nr:acetyl-CoA C-acyltransferase [Ruania zhangjianzhongii]